MNRLFFASCVALSALACNHDKAPDATPAASAVTAAPAASVAPDMAAASATATADPPVAAVDTTPVSPAVVAKIPAEEDFEPQAAAAITAANASQQLALIEKEIGK
jgi:hypothetical protein